MSTHRPWTHGSIDGQSFISIQEHRHYNIINQSSGEMRKSRLPQSMHNADQNQGIDPKFLSLPIIVHQCRINAACSGIDQHWSELIRIDQNWSEMTGIDRHWDQCQNFDQHWLTLLDIGHSSSESRIMHTIWNTSHCNLCNMCNPTTARCTF